MELEKWYIQVEVKDGETKVFSYEEISAMVLTKMKETTETFLGDKVKNDVITVPATKATDSKAAASKPGTSAKPKVTVVEPKKDESDDSDDSDDESEDDDLSDESDDDMSEDVDTPMKVEPPSKKRPSSSAAKTPVSTKKAKIETPPKTGNSTMKRDWSLTPRLSMEASKVGFLCNDGGMKVLMAGTCLSIKSNPGEVIKPDQFKSISDEGIPMYQRGFMKGNLNVHFNVEFPDSSTLDQVKALEAILPPKPAQQRTPMELDECEETTLHDVNIEEEM